MMVGARTYGQEKRDPGTPLECPSEPRPGATEDADRAQRHPI